MTKGRPVIINLKTGGAVRGLIVLEHGSLIELADAELLVVGDRGDTIARPVDGRLIVDTENIDYAQILPGG